MVPILLGVDKNATVPNHVDLIWSGNNPPYDIFQSVDCSDVFSSFFGTTGSNSFENISPPEVRLTCYNVLPTAPGPVKK